MANAGHGDLPARRFGDDEVAAILKRASARDARGGLPSPHDPTLDDLMSAAAEVGLDPQEVRRAAAMEIRQVRTAVEVALGGPDRREVSARLEGARIPVDTRQVVRRAEDTLHRTGTVEEDVPGRFAWRADGVGSRSRLVLTEVDGTLELIASTDSAGHYFGLLFVGLLTWAALSIATPLGALPLLGKAVALLVTPPLVARPFWAAADRRTRERLEDLALDVLRLAEDDNPA